MSITDFKTAGEIVRDLARHVDSHNGSLEHYVRRLVVAQQRDRALRPIKSYIVELCPESEGYEFTIVSINTSLPNPDAIMHHVVEKYDLPGEEWHIKEEKHKGDLNLLHILCKSYKPITIRRREFAKKKKTTEMKAAFAAMSADEIAELLQEFK